MKLAWKSDQWGRSAVVDGWLTLAVSRAGEQWYATIAGTLLASEPDGRSNPEPILSDDADDACQAAERRALEMVTRAHHALTSTETEPRPEGCGQGTRGAQSCG